MSNFATKRAAHLANVATAPWLSPFLAVRIAAIIAMSGAATMFAYQCVSQLRELESGSMWGLSTLTISIVAFVASQVCNMTRSSGAPEQ